MVGADGRGSASVEAVPATAKPSGQSAQHRRDPASVGEALTDLVIIHLDHPMWAVREGAAMVLAWLLTHGGSLAAQADGRAAAVLASTDDHPVLAAALSSAADEPSTPSVVSRPPRPVTADASPCGEGLGGDGVREMAARAAAAADEPGSRAVGVTGCGGGFKNLDRGPVRPAGTSWPCIAPAPAAVAYCIPAQYPGPPGLGGFTAHRGIDMGPYGPRAEVLAQAAGLSPNAVLHRLWRLTELAQRGIPDAEATDRAARATRFDGLLSAAAGQALRAAFGAVAAELIAAGH